MKKVLLVLVGVLFTSTAYAAPFITCDRDITTNPPTSYIITLPTGQTWLPTSTPALTAGTYGFKLDVNAAPVGTTLVKVKGCVTDTLWGQLCNAEQTFPLVRPSAPANMTNISLIP
jgi:hypothetical protein